MYIIPTPCYMEQKDKIFLLHYGAYITIDPLCSRKVYRQAVILQEKIKAVIGYELHVTYGKPRTGDIYLTYGEGDGFDPYVVTVDEDGIMLKGTEASLIWAIQTLVQILKQYGAAIPEVMIRDHAVFQYRGFYHDVTRGRVPKLSYLKWLADKLSEYKVNQLQLYVENTHLFRDFSEVWRDDDPLTTEEILELDDYCYDRGIELVPSISTFSHLYKVLRTKQFSELCELEHADQEPFAAWDKQMHHTLDITNQKSFPMVKKMIDEYRPLFRTRKFNMCADETFDLGLGRSKKYCERIGKDQAYIEFVKKLCDHLLSIGCEPMMWGDIIGKYPQLVKELPEEMTFLNWGYETDVKDLESRQFAEAGATFYNCPGVNGWSRMINNSDIAYKNIAKMAEYAHTYHAVGILNTDWGDYHHMNHPEFSLIGMIYGAEFSWSEKPGEYEELNRKLSVLEFGKGCEEAGAWIAEIDQNTVYSWMALCVFREYVTYYKELQHQEVQQYIQGKFQIPDAPEKVDSCNQILLEIQKKILGIIPEAKAEAKELLFSYAVIIDGCRYLNEVGEIFAKRYFLNQEIDREKAGILAGRLEEWLYYYKKSWRRVSKESELYRIQDIICWYADELRTIQ